MSRKTLMRVLAVVNVLSGMVIIAYVLFPIISYEKNVSPRFSQKKETSGKPITAGAEAPVDYTKASNWFEGTNPESFKTSSVTYYSISIPRLKIENATVSIGGEDLSKSLIQYPGTALPGKRGNAVIFGHSILPQFYNPKDYLAIFSTLPTLKEDDEISVYYDGISYQYRVEDMFEVLPADIEVLEQNPSDSFLTLVTCVPPGDPRKPRRLIVRARIIAPEGGSDAAPRY